MTKILHHPQWQKTPNIELGGKGDALICPNYPSKCWCRILSINRLRKAFLFVFGPQAIFTSNTPTHCARPCFMHLRQRDAYEGDRSGQSGLSRYVACQVYGTWFHRCMVSCSTKLGWVWHDRVTQVHGLCLRAPAAEADIEHTVNIQWTQHWTHIERSPKSCK